MPASCHERPLLDMGQEDKSPPCVLGFMVSRGTGQVQAVLSGDSLPMDNTGREEPEITAPSVETQGMPVPRTVVSVPWM